MPVPGEESMGCTSTPQPQSLASERGDDGDASGVSVAGSQATQKSNPRGRPKHPGKDTQPKQKSVRSRQDKLAGESAEDAQQPASSTKYVSKQVSKSANVKK